MIEPLARALWLVLVLCGSLAAQGADADWAWLRYGAAIGSKGLQVTTAGGETEILVSAGGPRGERSEARYWMLLRHDQTSLSYQQDFVSPVYPYEARIRRVLAADLLAATGPEILVAREDGIIEIWHQASRILIRTFDTEKHRPLAVEVGDINLDGYAEIVIAGAWGVEAFNLVGNSLWELSGFSAEELAIGQMDQDPTLEIATTGSGLSGTVIDAASGKFQWLRSGFGIDLCVADLDSDGMDELIAADRYAGRLQAYDVDTQTQKWPTALSGQAPCAAFDVDGDGTIEIISVEGYTKVSTFDGVTGVRETQVTQTQSGVTRFAFGDCDGDGRLEMVRGAGSTNSAEVSLLVSEPGNAVPEWSTQYLDGPFLGPWQGDVDGDGTIEIIAVSRSSGWRDGPRALIFDAVSRELETTSNELVPYLSADTQLANCCRLIDFDGDGDMELLVGQEDLAIYDWNAATGEFDPVWMLRPEGIYEPETRVWAVRIVDLDRDGQKEVVTCTDDYVYVHDFATKTKLWQSFFIAETLELEIANSDADPALEIHARSQAGHIYVFDGANYEGQALIHTLETEYSSVDSVPLGSQSVLIAGTREGELAGHVEMGGSWQTVGPLAWLDDPIDGLWVSHGAPWLLIGSGGRLSLYDGTLRVWQSAWCGDAFGAEFLILPGFPAVVSTSEFGLHGFLLR